FFVQTEGVNGVISDFEITHTFGWTPLQQYLVPFPGGRLQCLPLAWDSVKKEWFHLYQDAEFDSGDWMYWTNGAQNWNSMCADCHSTNYKKGYDFKSDSYNHSYSEINVSCEACHGPASRHVTWAETMQPLDSDNGLLVHTDKMTAREQVELCAFCHSRRSLFGDYIHGKKDLLDVLSPRLLDAGLYYADGQILDEVYVYNSFIQSKMFDRDVRCSDCHDMHSVKLHHKENQTCLQCHQADIYDNYQHHFHKYKGDKTAKPIKTADGSTLFAVGTGTDCVQCHMPGRIYMGNDYRPDHSMRIPRPDLNRELETPDACLRCHVDKNRQWSIDFTTKWYGEKRPTHYGSVLDAGRKQLPDAQNELIKIVGNSLYPGVVRATALELLGRYQSPEVFSLFKKNLDSAEALMRQTALAFMPTPREQRIKQVAPLLSDPVKGIRIEAAKNLCAIPRSELDPSLHEQHDKALTEFRENLEYSADFADARMNLGSLYLYRGELDQAEAAFKKAISIDRELYAAYRNLAILYSRQQKLGQAEDILRQALALNDTLYDIHYSLGLLLSEMKNYEEAVTELEKAAAGLPNHSRIHYNLGMLLEFMRRGPEAETALTQAVTLEPQNIQYLTALARLYLTESRLNKASELAKKMVAADPDNPIGHQLLEYISNL
ncbi:MAG: tetratricopeptide repeat protein, partial [Pseudomonadota bacterium]|nr:tetratricopeptide repeat protein [Pseudomonadota bacterium]